MALSCKKGSFAKSTGANGTTQSVTVGFQPKAIIFWWTEQTAEGYTDGHRIGIGFCDDTAIAAGNRACHTISDDAVATSASSRFNSNQRCIIWGTSAETVIQESYVSAIDSTSFTLTHSTNQAVATIIHYLAIGGSDITNTKADGFTTTTATGNQSITSLSFQPDAVLLISTKQSSTGASTNSLLLIGMATGSANACSSSMVSEDGRGTMDTWRFQRTDNIFASAVATTGAAGGLAAFTQFTSNGFDINWSVANDGSHLVHFLAIKGGNPFVSFLAQPVSTGIQTYNTISAKIPKGVMLFSDNSAANTAIQASARMIISATDGTSEGSAYSGDNDAVTPSVTAMNTTTAKAILLASAPAATGSSTTTAADADTDSFNSGNFKLNWTTVDATQREILFIAFSETVSSGTNMTEVAAKTHSSRFITKV